MAAARVAAATLPSSSTCRPSAIVTPESRLSSRGCIPLGSGHPIRHALSRSNIMPCLSQSKSETRRHRLFCHSARCWQQMFRQPGAGPNIASRPSVEFYNYAAASGHAEGSSLGASSQAALVCALPGSSVTNSVVCLRQATGCRCDVVHQFNTKSNSCKI